MSSSLCPSWLSLSFVVILVALVANVKADILDDVCPKTVNPQLCFQILKNNPDVHKGDIHNLLSVALSIAQNNSNSACDLVLSLVKPNEDPKMINLLTNCLYFYIDASDKLERCNDLYRTSDYTKISLFAASAFNDSRWCNRDFGGQPPAGLYQLSQNVQEFSNLVYVIANDLK